MNLCIDMDDVVADLAERVVERYNEDNEVAITVEDMSCWDRNWDLFKQYYQDDNIYGDLKVVEGSRDVLKRLIGEGYGVKFVTASPNDRVSEVKREWIDLHFPFIGSENVVVTRDKYKVPGDLLFDDSPEFITKFKGLRVLKDMPYNRNLSEGDFDYRVTSWGEFEDILRTVRFE